MSPTAEEEEGRRKRLMIFHFLFSLFLKDLNDDKKRADKVERHRFELVTTLRQSISKGHTSLSLSLFFVCPSQTLEEEEEGPVTIIVHFSLWNRLYIVCVCVCEIYTRLCLIKYLHRAGACDMTKRGHQLN